MLELFRVVRVLGICSGFRCNRYFTSTEVSDAIMHNRQDVVRTVGIPIRLDSEIMFFTFLNVAPLDGHIIVTIRP